MVLNRPSVLAVFTVRRLAIFATIGPVLFWVVALGVVTPLERSFLHSLGWRETGLSPVPYPSATALGAFGWLQILNFGQMGLSLVALAIGLWRSVVPRPRVGITFVFLAGVALLASMFKTDPTSGTPVTWHGWIHSLAFVLLVVSFAGGVIALAIELRTTDRWRWVGYSGLGLLALALLPFGRLLPPLPFIDVAKLVVGFAWFELLAVRLVFLAPPEVSDRQESVADGLK